MSCTPTPSLLASWRHRAVLVQARHRGEALARARRGRCSGDERVGVGGVAHHEDPHVVGGRSLIAWPCGLKIAPLASSRSARSMPFVRGRAPMSSPTLQPSNASFGIRR
jgi:hypothetical protein